MPQLYSPSILSQVVLSEDQLFYFLKAFQVDSHV